MYSGAYLDSATDHPRSRGEYLREGLEEYDTDGSSPLSRGIRFFNLPDCVESGIIPALAGNTGS